MICAGVLAACLSRFAALFEKSETFDILCNAALVDAVIHNTSSLVGDFGAWREVSGLLE